ncbi:hypothetical protein QFZ57_000612 [Arthrobacter sp. B1I2]|nr:hypothetical protein [Arthrobacter sp. B1I2]
MGYRDQEGFLFVSDRLKDMIISGGENIYPAEVEAVIAEHGAVSSVAVIGVSDDNWGEVPQAIVTLREGESLTEEQLRSFLDGRLARYKIPQVAGGGGGYAAHGQRQDPEDGARQAAPLITPTGQCGSAVVTVHGHQLAEPYQPVPA